MIYLDNGATTPLDPKVKEIYIDAISNDFGNPSSMHRLGISSEKKLKIARRNIAKLLGGKEEQILFTSGGTEANNLAILGSINNNKRNRYVTTSIEHPSVLSTMKYLEKKGKNVSYVGLKNDGTVDVEKLYSLLNDDVALVSIMHINNETGLFNDVYEMANKIKSISPNTLVHVDGIQSFGKVKINIENSQIDMYSFSSHKIHGPKGVGGLYYKKNVTLKPRVFGGGQEKAIRPGTENLHGIIAFGEAAQIAKETIDNNYEHVSMLKKRMMDGLMQIENSHFNSQHNGMYSPYILNVSFADIRGEVLLHALESKEVYISTGSACSSKKKSYSHVLEALGLNENLKEGAIRISFSKLNTIEEIDRAIDIISKEVAFLRKIIGGR